MSDKRLGARGSRLGAGDDACPYQGDVLDAARTGRWPERIDDELRAHAATCATCSELSAIAPLLCEEWDDAIGEAKPPSADLMWWRVQRRARLEAARAAEAPVHAARLVAALGAVLLVVVAGWWVFGPLGQLLSELLSHAPAPADALRPGAPPLLRGAALLALLAGIVFVPVALYLTFADE